MLAILTRINKFFIIGDEGSKVTKVIECLKPNLASALTH